MSRPDAFIRSMARRRSASTNAWSTVDIRLLRELAGQNVPVEVIAATLRRSPSAIKNKAGMHGISLRRADAPAGRQCG